MKLRGSKEELGSYHSMYVCMYVCMYHIAGNLREKTFVNW